MAQIWLTVDADQWAVLPMEGREIALTGLRWRRLRSPQRGSHSSGQKPHGSQASPKHPEGQGWTGNREEGQAVLLLRRSGVSGQSYPWILLSGPDARVWVNGVPMLSGAHVLRDRDEIRVGSEPPVYFSLESLARVEAMGAATREIFCPRCSLELTVGTPAVRCPGCGIWHHSSEEYPCWCYAPTCALCPQPTAFDTGFQWTPADL